ncbi:MAG: iron ABC transporter permease [Sphaerochaetaceae bacterium]|nr:iron ABC transporter permease [Sphaerochaetaceae bacterium]
MFPRLFSTGGIVLYSLIFTLPLLITLLQTNLGSLREAVSNSYYLHILRFSFTQALLSALLSLAVGIPGALIMSYRSFRFKRQLKALFYLPFILPPILVVLGFVIFYGNSGYLNKILFSLFGVKIKILYSFTAVLLAHTFYNFPIVITLVSNSINKLGHSCEEAALVDGASAWKSFTSIILPRILPSALSAAIIVFLYCFTSFAIILVLGGGPQLTTLEVEIYRQARISSNIPMASALSILSTVTVVIVLLINSAVENRSSEYETDYSGVRVSRLSFVERIYLTLVTLFVSLPLLSIFIKSFSASAWKSAARVIGSAVNSLGIALVSAVVSTLLALSLSYLISLSSGRRKGLIMTYCTLPMVTSSVILGLSYYVVSRSFGFLPGFFLLALSHGALSAPFGVRTITSVWKDIPPELAESARTSGAAESTVFFKIHLPLLKPAVLSCLMFSFAISMGELNATMILSPSSFTTIPLQIYRMVAAYNYEGACALGSVLCLICFSVFFVFSRDGEDLS